MKQGKKRTFSICLTDIPKERILIHENGKKYLNLETWDLDEPKFDNDFSVKVSLNKEELEKVKAGEKIYGATLGWGRIWESVSKSHEATPEELKQMEENDDLPF
jgi:hypothetical protein